MNHFGAVGGTPSVYFIGSQHNEASKQISVSKRKIIQPRAIEEDFDPETTSSHHRLKILTDHDALSTKFLSPLHLRHNVCCHLNVKDSPAWISNVMVRKGETYFLLYTQ